MVPELLPEQPASEQNVAALPEPISINVVQKPVVAPEVSTNGGEHIIRDSILTKFIDKNETNAERMEIINNSILRIQRYIHNANMHSPAVVKPQTPDNGSHSSAAFREAVQEATPGRIEHVVGQHTWV